MQKAIKSFLLICLIFCTFTKNQVFASDADFWKIAKNYEQKYIFVSGLRSGLVAADNINLAKLNALAAASKDLPDSERKMALNAAGEVSSAVSNATIYALLDKNFVPNFINYLDKYFEDPKNQSAGDALLIFLSNQAKKNSNTH